MCLSGLNLSSVGGGWPKPYRAVAHDNSNASGFCLGRQCLLLQRHHRRMKRPKWLNRNDRPSAGLKSDLRLSQPTQTRPPWRSGPVRIICAYQIAPQICKICVQKFDINHARSTHFSREYDFGVSFLPILLTISWMSAKNCILSAGQSEDRAALRHIVTQFRKTKKCQAKHCPTHMQELSMIGFYALWGMCNDESYDPIL